MKTTLDSTRPLNWDDLQVFLSVVQHGSILGAARALRVNHSTVLRRVGSLEGALATRLFDRLPSGYALTSSGGEIAERLAGITEQIDAAHRHVMGLDVAIKGIIRLTSTDTLVHLLMPLIVRFQAHHPGVQVQLVVNNSFLSLSRREADVAIRGSNRPPENLVGRRVGNIQTALYASRAYLDSVGRQTSLQDYAWVAPDESLSHLEQARWLIRNIPAERIAVQVDSLVGMVDAVEQGAGVGMLLCPLAQSRPGLVQLEPPEERLNTQVWILTHPELKQVARIRAFTQFMFDALSTHASLSR